MRKAFVLIVSILLPFFLNAQFYVEQCVKIGTGSVKMKDRDTDNSFSSSVGFNFCYVMAKKIPVSIGVSHSMLKYNDLGSSDFENPNNPAVRNEKIKGGYRSLQMPFSVGYFFDIKRMKIIVNAGLYGDYFLEDKYWNAFSNIGSFGHRLNWGCLFNVGAGFKIADEVLVSLSFNYNSLFNNATKVSTYEGVYDKNTFVGARVGVSYFF